MVLNSPPTESALLLSEAAALLFGDGGGVVPQLAAGLGGMNERTILAWWSGKQQLQPDHGVMVDVRRLLIARRDQIDDLIRRLDDNIA